MHRLFAYADTSDLSHLEGELVVAFNEFVQTWSVAGARLVNRKAPLMPEQEIPDWNIGLSLESQVLNRDAVEQLLLFLSALSRKTSLPFVLGTWSREHGTSDLCRFERHIPDGSVGTIVEGTYAAA